MSEEKEPQRRRNRKDRAAEEGVEEGVQENPFGAYLQSEAVFDKLKLLNYDKDFCKSYHMSPINPYYFAFKHDSNEQLWYFGSLLCWLLSLSKIKYAAPEQYDDPSTILSTATSQLKNAGIPNEFSQSTLRQGFGEEICHILNLAAQKALKSKHWAWAAPVHKHEEFQQEEDAGDAVEVTSSAEGGNDEEIEEEADFDEDDQDFIDVDATKDVSHVTTEKAAILESHITNTEWKVEVERVLPQLKVHIRNDTKDWRNHLAQMKENTSTVEGALGDTKGYLSQLGQEIEKTLAKIGSREKYINGQLESLITEYRQNQDSYAMTKERYKEASKTVTEFSQQLAALTAELESIKAEMDERGTSITDASPLVKIRNNHKALVAEISQMDMRIGVIQHMLLAAKVQQKGEIVQDMTTRARDPFNQSEEWK
eukprot:m.82362 g.82362  ORF g.82362 m.82362 type:complete len:425 (-) comp8666_c0_seq5:1739-3013(-)